MNLSINARHGILAVLAVVLLGFGLCGVGEPVHAQAIGSQKAAEEALRAGLAAQKARHHDVAVREFSRAINAGSLARKQLTYALFRRAISNRAQRQPAQAISDLNGALFFKGDLSMGDRAKAIEERMKAFQDAGLKPTAIATADPDAQWHPTATTPVKPATPARPRVVSSAPPRVLEPVQVTRPRTSSSVLSPTTPILAPVRATARAKPATPKVVPSFKTRVAATPSLSSPTSTAALRRPPVRKPAPVVFSAPKVQRGIGVLQEAPSKAKAAIPAKSWQVATKSEARAPTRSNAALPSPNAAVAASPAGRGQSAGASVVPAESRKPVNPSNGGGITQFFSSLFGGAETQVQAARPMTTASVKKPINSSVSKYQATPLAASSAVRQPAHAKPVVAATARQRLLSTASQPIRNLGKLEIEVAVLRNKDRADALSQQLMVEYPDNFFWSAKKTARVVQIGTDDEGNTRYSVRYGVFESRADLDATCEKFKSDGHGCEVVPQGDAAH